MVKTKYNELAVQNRSFCGVQGRFFLKRAPGRRRHPSARGTNEVKKESSDGQG